MDSKKVHFEDNISSFSSFVKKHPNPDLNMFRVKNKPLTVGSQETVKF